MEKITVKCPNCGNRMEIDPKIIAFRCANCGERIDLDEEPIKPSDIIGIAKTAINRSADVKIAKAKNGVAWTPDQIIQLICLFVVVGMMIAIAVSIHFSK